MLDNTTYHCKVYKVAANITNRRHTIAMCIVISNQRQTLYLISCFQDITIIAPASRDIIHQLLMYESDPMREYDENSLSEGLCGTFWRTSIPVCRICRIIS